VFRPGLAKKTGADALRAAAAVGEALDRQLARVAPEPAAVSADGAATGCRARWRGYCQAVQDAVAFALARHKPVLVGHQPLLLGDVGEAHVEQQRETADMLARLYDGDARVRYVNLGHAADLADPQVSFDRMHLTPAGNQHVADELVAPVVEMAGVEPGAPKAP